MCMTFKPPGGTAPEMMNIITWAQENYGKQLSLNSVYQCIQKGHLNLCYTIHKKETLLGAQAHVKRTDK